jgi:hypothetical protein
VDVRLWVVSQGQAKKLDGAVGDGEVVAQGVGGGADDAQVERRQVLQFRQGLVQLGFRLDEGGHHFVLVGGHALFPGNAEPPKLSLSLDLSQMGAGRGSGEVKPIFPSWPSPGPRFCA